MNKSTTSTTSHLSSISSSDLIDAKLEEHHELCGSKQYCPGCGHKLEGKPDWVGLPAGVKFDPTDQELVEHLEGKVETSKELVKSHPLIDEFIPTIEGEDGICYTHPEKLPGVTRDGLSRHFFHRPSKAYTTGTRKRRKIQTESDLPSGETRWHKTGKTRPVMVNGKQKGCKKILVLYTNFGKNRRPEKTNWVMHQYHLGQHEEEREGELVVSKIFYQTQPRQCGWSDRAVTTTGEGNGDIGNSIRDGGGGSGGGTGGSSFSKEGINTRLRDEVCAAGAVAVGAMSSYTDLDIEQLKEADHLYFAPFRKSCDEACMHVGVVSTEFSTLREELQGPASSMCEARDIREHQMPPPHEYVISHENQNHQQHHCQNVATTAFHICCRPSHDSISTIVSPPDSGLHHTSVVFDEDSFHVSRIALQNENFQQLQQQHHKLGRGSTSGLEELIMSCTSSDIKEESAAAAIRNPQEPTEWLKYSTNFWPDPDNNPDHHG